MKKKSQPKAGNKLIIRQAIVTGIALLTQLTFAHAQCTSPYGTYLPSSVDSICLPQGTACPTTSTLTVAGNTGADICTDPANGNASVKVFVWDGSSNDGSFSWKYGTAMGSQLTSTFPHPSGGTLGFQLLDPDVVVQFYTGVIRAMVVGIVSGGPNAGRVYWISLRWNGTTFISSGNFGFLMMGSSAAGNILSNPNIDCNASGDIAIAWSEQNTYTATVSITLPNPPFSPSIISQNMNITRGDVYVIPGFLDGLRCDQLNTISNFTPRNITYYGVANSIITLNQYPDVAISERLNPAVAVYTISATYINHSLVQSLGTFTFRDSLMIKQYNGDCGGVAVGTPLTYYAYYFDPVNFPQFPYTGGRPRIAARPTKLNSNDIQVVLGKTAAACIVSPPTCVTYYSPILNWGRHNGGAINTTPFLLNGGATNTPVLTAALNDDPVVTYWDSLVSNTGTYIVAWAFNDADLASNCTKDYDIITRSYQNGVKVYGLLNTAYAIVNKGNCNANDVSGDQLYPSIAGRFMYTGGQGKKILYAFYDNSISSGKHCVAFKALGGLPGNGTPLRLAGQGGGPLPVDPSDFSVMPNPFSNEVIFALPLRDGVKNQKIEIYNSEGKMVDQLNLNNEEQIQWKPKSLPNGIYISKLYNSEGMKVLKFVKEE